MQKHMSLLASTHTMIETKKVQVEVQDSETTPIQTQPPPEIIIDKESGFNDPVYTETLLSNSIESESNHNYLSEDDLNCNTGYMSDIENNNSNNKRLSIKVLAENIEDKTQILQMLLHCADLANPTKEFETYKKWTDKVMTEFWNQGDLEKKLGLSVQAMYDKEKADVISTQLGFLDFIVVPLWEMWVEICPESLSIIEQLDRNRGVYGLIEN